MAYHGLGPAATQLLDSAPSSSRGGHPGCPCSVLATSSAQHASLQTQASLPLPSSSSCPASALHRHSLLVPMSSTSDMVLLQHVHPSSRANCHPSFEYPSTVAIDRPFYSHHLDSSRLSPIIDVLSTQIGAACRLSTNWGRLPPITDSIINNHLDCDYLLPPTQIYLPTIQIYLPTTLGGCCASHLHATPQQNPNRFLTNKPLLLILPVCDWFSGVHATARV
eukprot:888918_1